MVNKKAPSSKRSSRQSDGSFDLESMHDPEVGDQFVPSPARDQELIDRKQAQIVEGACQVMFRKGFHGTSIRDIAAACNMSMGQLYHYIASKDDILYLIHRHMQALWFKHLVDSGFQEIHDPKKRLESTIRLALQFIDRNKELILFIYTETKYLEKKYLGKVLEIDEQNVVNFYRKLLDDLPELNLDQTIRDTAANLMSFVVVFLALRGWKLNDKDLDKNIEFITSFIMRGLGMGD